MKKCIFFIAAILLSACTCPTSRPVEPSYRVADEGSSPKSDVPTSSNVYVEETSKRKVVKILHTLAFACGGGGYAGGPISVAYVLLEDGEVLVFNKTRARAPYTKEEAKILMLAELGEDVYVEAK